MSHEILIDSLRALAEGLDLDDADDRAIYRSTLLRRTQHTKVDALREVQQELSQAIKGSPSIRYPDRFRTTLRIANLLIWEIRAMPTSTVHDPEQYTEVPADLIPESNVTPSAIETNRRKH